jgi:ABC-type multidrug transport system permease subunit
VLPAILVIAGILRHFRAFENAHSSPLSHPGRLHPPLLALGFACLFLPLRWPGIFFPLVWLGFAFLLDPLLHRLGGAPFILRDLENGRPGRLYILLLSGILCGVLWEAWNYPAGAKWVYTIPLVGRFKIFEMPVLGFFGFPPFVLECIAMTRGFDLLADRFNRKFSGPRRSFAWAVFAVIMLAFDFLIFAGIDFFTVKSLAVG